MLWKKKKSNKPVGDKITIREGISGTFFYHIAVNDVPVCGNKNTMTTQIPISYWGKVGHLRERYCNACTEGAARQNIVFEEKK